ncbi:cysteine/glutathione ABC transporter permease/ATP-binding protein CydD [Pectobacterium aroidearum]|uniref:Cysteine/glutathione ABC transporter permease/ATP-binding protein CydD n=1 Tax=Pectobacterium aroidearum TaxID=1201031 RepID=A0ABR5Z809_9GAMM|nr:MULTISPECIES: cysteine/glutathione ABC transporter permease/ATP-binding protein CydD [Pectobacterium]MBA5197895.1 cysteine/glutathione ABC transporter permease/ATP-binding protein CydD [Pectobacterium aroidearum]MBA5227562.1 cysteine/glutathione ABC transporter permease/ATP-binding protein CydD [Pectobacterium aroidearum]MBA5230688.1 cysteine/glutathione ABC transporter permease/ATP-binding protein CydD [Pectobacterium aroidearum]MBA5735873.1 cysteine/glutathione ABC transporter permease/ATP
MKKTRQQELTAWLKQQSKLAQRWLRISLLLGFLSGALIVAQAWLLATLLHALIIEHAPRESLLSPFLLLIATFVLRALNSVLRERVGFLCGQAVRQQIRKLVLDRLQQLGPAWVQGKPAGSWATMILEQVDDMQDYYARYLPQMYLAALIPLLILITVFPLNWAAGLILFLTAPLIPLFMALVGMGAADANRRNFLALARLSGHFLDRLRGMETLRLFHRGEAETEQIRHASEDFRSRTMEVLRMAFLSSGVLEFFASISIAVVAVYFGFSYLGELDFGHYGMGVTLFAGFLVLILAPEFFQPLRDLGTFYHAKAQAIGAAESLVTFLAEEGKTVGFGTQTFSSDTAIAIRAENLVVLAPNGTPLTQPLTFDIRAGERIALVGISGAGKSSLLNALLGFLPYRGSLTVNGQALNTLTPESWRKQLSWVGQNPHLPEQTLRSNILLGNPQASIVELQRAIERAYVQEFLPQLPQGLETTIGDGAARLSVGQAQRVAVARALIHPCNLLLLDEPSASLDAHSEELVMTALNDAARHQTTLLVTHQLADITEYDAIWVMDGGQLVQQGDYQTLRAEAGPFATLLAQRQEAL